MDSSARLFSLQQANAVYNAHTTSENTMSFFWLVIIIVAVLALTYFAARRGNRRIQTPENPRSYAKPVAPVSAPATIVRSSTISSAPPRSVAHHTTTQRSPVASTRTPEPDHSLVNNVTTLAALQALDTHHHESRQSESATRAYEPTPVEPVVAAIDDDSSRYRTTGGFGGESYHTSASIPDSSPSPSYSAPSYSSPSSSDYNSSSSSDYGSSSGSDSSSSGGWSD